MKKKEGRHRRRSLNHRQKGIDEEIGFRQLPLIAFFKQEPGYEFVRELLVKIANDESEGYVTSVNIGEVYYMTARKSSQKNAELVLDALLKFPLHIVDADLNLSLEAAKLKAKYSLSYADALAAALTITRKATLITGDEEFRNLDRETNFKVRYL